MRKIMKKINSLREEKGWTKVQLLREVNMNISQSYFCNMEKGFYFPPPSFVIKAAIALGAKPDALYELVIQEKKEILEKQLRNNFEKEYKKVWKK